MILPQYPATITYINIEKKKRVDVKVYLLNPDVKVQTYRHTFMYELNSLILCLCGSKGFFLKRMTNCSNRV